MISYNYKSLDESLKGEKEMDKYETPKLELNRFENSCIITDSITGTDSPGSDNLLPLQPLQPLQ